MLPPGHSYPYCPGPSWLPGTCSAATLSTAAVVGQLEEGALGAEQSFQVQDAHEPGAFWQVLEDAHQPQPTCGVHVPQEWYSPHVLFGGGTQQTASVQLLDVPEFGSHVSAAGQHPV